MNNSVNNSENNSENNKGIVNGAETADVGGAPAAEVPASAAVDSGAEAASPVSAAADEASAEEIPVAKNAPPKPEQPASKEEAPKPPKAESVKTDGGKSNGSGNAAAAKKQNAARIVVNTGDTARSEIDKKKVLETLVKYSYPEHASGINKVIHWVETRVLDIPPQMLIENLAKWASQAKDYGAEGRMFLSKIASCAMTYDTFGMTDIDVFIALFRIAPEVAASYDECEKVIVDVLDRHSEDFSVVIDGLLLFFRREDNYKYLTNFFKLLFTNEDSSENKNFVNAAWTKILCDKEINQRLHENRYFGTRPGKIFASHIQKHQKTAVGRALPEALKLALDNKKKNMVKLVGLAAAVVVVVIVAIVGIKFANSRAMDKSTIEIDYPTEVTLAYGEELELAGKKITYYTNGGELVTVDITAEMVKNFNPNKVGEQTVTINYGGKSHVVKVTVTSVVLAAPTLKFDNGTISWDAVEGAGKYLLELRDTDGNMIDDPEISDATQYTVDSNLAVGAYEVIVTAKATESRWSDSPASKKLSFEKRVGVTEIKWEDERIVWTEVPGAKSYRVTLNGEELEAKNAYIARPLVGGANDIKVSVVYDGTVIYTDKSVTIRKLTTPQLIVSNRTVICNESGVVFYLDGVEFDGDLAAAITQPGVDYKITAKRFPTADGEIASDESEPITVKKLPTPMLTIADNALVVQEGYTVEYYLNGEVFNGKIIDIVEPNTYSVTAKFKGDNGYVLDSEMSNPVTFSKLAVPAIDYDPMSKTVYVTDDSGSSQLYLNGEAFDGNVSNLGEGYFTVTARNVGDGVTSISSAESEPFYITNVEASITVADSGNGYANIYLDTDIENVKYDITIVYYAAGEKIRTSTNGNLTNKLQKAYYNQGGKIADKMEITIVLYPPSNDFETRTINYTWEK